MFSYLDQRSKLNDDCYSLSSLTYAAWVCVALNGATSLVVDCITEENPFAVGIWVLS